MMSNKRSKMMDELFEIGAVYKTTRSKNAFKTDTDDVKGIIYAGEHIVLLSKIKYLRNSFSWNSRVSVLTQFGVCDFLINEEMFINSPAMIKVSSSGYSSVG